MSFNFDNVFGIHEAALRLRAERTDVLAANIANSDTPGYKARDIDFATAMKQALSKQSPMTMAATNPSHMSTQVPAVQDTVMYRIPFQPALDGNTVEPQVEQAAFAKNAIEYQASLKFLQDSISSLTLAIKGQ